MPHQNTGNSVLAELWRRGYIQAIPNSDSGRSSTGWQRTAFFTNGISHLPSHSASGLQRRSLPSLISFSDPPKRNESAEKPKCSTPSYDPVYMEQESNDETIQTTAEVLPLVSNTDQNTLGVPSTVSARSSVSIMTTVYSPENEKPPPNLISSLPDEPYIDGFEEGEGINDVFKEDVSAPALPRKASARERAMKTPKDTIAREAATPSSLGSSGSQTERIKISRNDSSPGGASIRLRPSTSTASDPSSGSSSNRSKRYSVFSPDEVSPASVTTEMSSASPERSELYSQPVMKQAPSMPRSSPPMLMQSESSSNSGSLSGLSPRRKITRFVVPESTLPEEPELANQRDMSTQSDHRRGSSSPSEASISRYIRRTRLPGGRMEPNDVRRLDGVEVAEGVELATQNTDGKPVPELEAEEIQQLPTPPEAQEGPGLVNSASDSGYSSLSDRLRAASPPPPPNYNPDQIRKIKPRAANIGRSLRQSHFTEDLPNPLTKIKDKLEDAVHAVTGTSNSNDDQRREESRIDLIPDPEIIGPGSIPESVLIGPPKTSARTSPNLPKPPDPLSPPNEYHLFRYMREQANANHRYHTKSSRITEEPPARTSNQGQGRSTTPSEVGKSNDPGYGVPHIESSNPNERMYGAEVLEDHEGMFDPRLLQDETDINDENDPVPWETTSSPPSDSQCASPIFGMDRSLSGEWKKHPSWLDPESPGLSNVGNGNGYMGGGGGLKSVVKRLMPGLHNNEQDTGEDGLRLAGDEESLDSFDRGLPPDIGKARRVGV